VNSLAPRVVALAEAFEAEAGRLFTEARSGAVAPQRRLVLEVRGETWLRAAARLRAVVPLMEARSALPGDRPTAA
jgi:hypothetical protein